MVQTMYTTWKTYGNASYIKPEMQALDAEAKKKGIAILNELGLDPGIDHMSAMRIIDAIHAKGGKVEEFYSLCGALPAPESSNDNPFRYKFSWSPKGVVLAGNNEAVYKKQGKVVHSDRKFIQDVFTIDFPELESRIISNRDSCHTLIFMVFPRQRLCLENIALQRMVREFGCFETIGINFA